MVEWQSLKSTEINKQPLFKILETKFVKKAERKEDRRRKKVIDEKKIKFKPIRIQEIGQHARSHDKLIQAMMAKKKEERDRSLSNSFNPSVLRTELHKQLVINDQQEKLQKEVEEEKKRALKAKKLNYDQFIRMVHKPAVDQNKVDELQNRIDKLKHPVKDKIVITPGMTMSQIEKLQGSKSER